MTGASYTRTCAGCDQIVTEQWVKNQVCFSVLRSGALPGIYRRHRAARPVRSGVVSENDK